MDSNRPAGLLRNLSGRLQDAVGGLTGDPEAQARGKIDQAAGQAQDAYGEILDHVERVASSRPLITVAVAAAAGFVLGIVVARR